MMFRRLITRPCCLPAHTWRLPLPIANVRRCAAGDSLLGRAIPQLDARLRLLDRQIELARVNGHTEKEAELLEQWQVATNQRDFEMRRAIICSNAAAFLRTLKEESATLAANIRIDGQPVTIDRLAEAATLPDGTFNWQAAVFKVKSSTTCRCSTLPLVKVLNELRPAVVIRHALKHTTLGDFLTTSKLRSFLPHDYADTSLSTLAGSPEEKSNLLGQRLIDIDFANWGSTPNDHLFGFGLQMLKQTNTQWDTRDLADFIWDSFKQERLTFNMSYIVGKPILGDAFEKTLEQIVAAIFQTQNGRAAKEDQDILFVTSTPRNSKSALLEAVLHKCISENPCCVTLRVTYNSETPFDAELDANPDKLAARFWARAVASVVRDYGVQSHSNKLDDLAHHTQDWPSAQALLKDILGDQYPAQPFFVVVADEFSRVVDATGTESPKIKAAYSKITALLANGQGQIVFSGFRVGSASAFATMSSRREESYFLPNLDSVSRTQQFAPLLCALSLLGGTDAVAYECMKHSAGLLGYAVERLARQQKRTEGITPWSQSLSRDRSVTVPAVIQALRQQFSEKKFDADALDRFQRLHILTIVGLDDGFVSPHALWALRKDFSSHATGHGDAQWESRLYAFWDHYISAVEAYTTAEKPAITKRKGRVAEILCRIAVELRALADDNLLTCVGGNTTHKAKTVKPVTAATLDRLEFTVDAFPCLESFMHEIQKDGTTKRLVETDPVVLNCRRQQIEGLLKAMAAKCRTENRVVAAVLDIDGDNMATDAALIRITPTATELVDIEVRMHEVKYGHGGVKNGTKRADAQRGIDDIFSSKLLLELKASLPTVSWTLVRLGPPHRSFTGPSAPPPPKHARIPIQLGDTDSTKFLTRTFVSMLIDEDITMPTNLGDVQRPLPLK